MNTLVSSIGIIGLIIGSFSAGHVVKAGRRRSIIAMSMIAAIGIVLTLVLKLWAILLGKFIYGTTSGIIIVASSLYLQETIPAAKSATFDFSTNFGVILGIFINLLVGLGLPQTDEGMMEDQYYWRLILGLPLVFIVLQLILWLFAFKHESLNYCFSIKDFDSCRYQVNKIYLGTE